MLTRGRYVTSLPRKKVVLFNISIEFTLNLSRKPCICLSWRTFLDSPKYCAITLTVAKGQSGTGGSGVGLVLQDRLHHEIRKVDSSGRLSLGRQKVGEQYDVEEAFDGKTTVTPVVVIPKRDVRYHNNPEAREAVLQGLSDSVAGRSFDGGHFIKCLDEPDEE